MDMLIFKKTKWVKGKFALKVKLFYCHYFFWDSTHLKNWTDRIFRKLGNFLHIDVNIKTSSRIDAWKKDGSDLYASKNWVNVERHVILDHIRLNLLRVFSNLQSKFEIKSRHKISMGLGFFNPTSQLRQAKVIGFCMQ